MTLRISNLLNENTIDKETSLIAGIPDRPMENQLKFLSMVVSQHPVSPKASSSDSSVSTDEKYSRPKANNQKVKGKKKNTRISHILSERKKRRQMNYLYSLILKCLGFDPNSKITKVETLILAINKISEGKMKVNLKDINFDLEKEGDEKFFDE